MWHTSATQADVLADTRSDKGASKPQCAAVGSMVFHKSCRHQNNSAYHVLSCRSGIAGPSSKAGLLHLAQEHYSRLLDLHHHRPRPDAVHQQEQKTRQSLVVQ